MKTYCQSCGEATEFSIRAPLLCAYCGNSFSNANYVAPKPVVNQARVVRPPAPPARSSVRQNRRELPPAQDLDEDEPLDDDMDADVSHLVESISNVNPKSVFTVHATKANRSSLKDASTGASAVIQRRIEDDVKPSGKKQTAKQILKEFAQEAGSLRKK